MAGMFPILTLPEHDSAHARGLSHGRLASAQVMHSRDTYARLFASCGIDWATACTRAQAYLPAIQALDADLVQEMQGIAEGSGLQMAEVLALNCRTEILPASFLSDVHHQAETALAANRAAGWPDWLDTLDPRINEGECTAISPTAHREAETAKAHRG